MSSILITIINMSIAGSVVIILGLIMRCFLQRLSKEYSYFLWGIVCLRLICPFGIDFQSVLNLALGKEAGNIISLTEYIPQSAGAVLFNSDRISTNTSMVTFIIIFIAAIWFLGFVGMIIYEVAAYFNTRKRLLTAIKIQDSVFETDKISSPCIFGLSPPKIYVPAGMTEKELNYVLCHGFIHIKRKDYLVKLLECFILAIHWFNPFVWLAFKYMSIDMEMSCDEKVVATLGNGIRKEYAEIICNFSKTKINGTRSMLTFGASDTQKRVTKLLNKSENTKIRTVTAVIICIIITVFLISNSAISSLFVLVRDGINMWEIQRIATTDLSNVTIDGIHIGSNINDIDLSVYNESDRLGYGNHAYYLDRLRVDVDSNNEVNYIFGYNSEVLISVNTQRVMSATIDDIASLLGDEYLDKVEDNEQKLCKYIYYDSKTGVIAEFIYDDYNRQLVWLVLKKDN